MNAMKKVLLVALDSVSLSQIQNDTELRRDILFQELALQEEALTELHSPGAGHEVVGLVLGPNIEDPIQTSQRIHSFSHDLSVLVLTSVDRWSTLRLAIQFSPYLGENVMSTLAGTEGHLVLAVRDLVSKADLRSQYRSMVQVSNLKLEFAKLTPSEFLPAQYWDRLLDQAPIGIANLSDDLKILAWNRYAFELTGLSEREAIGESILPLFLDTEEKRLRHFLTSAKSEDSNKRISEVFSRRSPRDEIQFWELTRSFVQGRGESQGLLVLLQDITERRRLEFERKQAEEALRVSETQIHLIADSLPVLISYIDLNQNYKFVNATYKQWLGISFAEASGKFIGDILGENLYRQIQPKIKEALSGRVMKFEIEATFADGNRKILQTTYIPDFDSEQRVRGVVILADDITARKRSEARTDFLSDTTITLSESLDSELTLKKVAVLAVPRIADLCFVVESEGGYSQLVSALTESAIQSLISKYPHLAALISSGEINSLISVPFKTASGASLGTLVFIVTKKSDRRYDSSDLKFFEEFTRRCALAMENTQLLSQLREAVRTRDEFLSIASHELKTPITSLKLQAQMQQRRRAHRDPAIQGLESTDKLIDSFVQQIDRMSKLIDDMLDISRIAHGKLYLEPVRFNLGEMVREVVDRFSEQLRAQGCTLKLSIESSVVGQWDRYRIEQVVVNLMTNALKYGEGKPIEVKVMASNGNALIQFKDQGMGIARENLDRIFRRFERAVSSSNISGLGLGLYISRQIVEAHGGMIRVASFPGQGSVFTVELPLI